MAQVVAGDPAFDSSGYRHERVGYPVTREQQIAYVQAMTVACQVEMAAMQAANADQVLQGYPMAYNYEHFIALIEKYGIHHNQLLTTMSD